MSVAAGAAPRSRGLLVWTCVLAAVMLVAVLGTCIASYDIYRHIEAQRADEVGQRQSHAERSAAHIASQLADDETPYELAAVKRSKWLRAYWTRTLSRQPSRLYAAVVDLEGRVIAHTNRRHEGQELHPSFARVPERTEIIEIQDDVLASGRRAIDVRVPIEQGNKIIGVYHAGIDADWLDNQLALERVKRTKFWAILVSGMCGLLLLSSFAVVQVTRHTARLEHEIEAAHARRVSEMHELVLGIAHEIRNPLNAIRLNLHTVGQVFRDEAILSDDEIATMLDEMEDEVARLETLMREMLGFARTGKCASKPLDVAEEVHRTLMFLRANLDQRNIDVRLDVSEEPCVVMMEGSRLRQVLINLLNNSSEAVSGGGRIEIAVQSARGQVEITVRDDGPGIAPQDRERVFVPFFSTKASGTGLGLALARKFVEEAGGTICCESSSQQPGTCFRILLPAVSAAVVEEVT